MLRASIFMISIVTSGFGKVISNIYFLQDTYKSYRQVLTSITNSSLLIKLQNFDKSRLATLTNISHKEIQRYEPVLSLMEKQ